MLAVFVKMKFVFQEIHSELSIYNFENSTVEFHMVAAHLDSNTEF